MRWWGGEDRKKLENMQHFLKEEKFFSRKLFFTFYVFVGVVQKRSIKANSPKSEQKT